MYFENIEIFLEYSSEESAKKAAEYLKSFYISSRTEETETHSWIIQASSEQTNPAAYIDHIPTENLLHGKIHGQVGEVPFEYEFYNGRFNLNNFAFPEETEEKFIEHLPNLTIMNCVREAVRRGLL